MAFAYVLLFPTRILVVGPLSRLYNQTFYEYLPVCFVYYLLFMHTSRTMVELNRIQKICHFIRNLGRLLQDIKCERRPTQIMAKPTDVEEK